MKKIVALIIVISILLTMAQVNVFAAGNGPEAQYEEGMEFFEQKDYDRAFSRFQISGDAREYTPAQNMLGVCYRDGLGVEQDLGEAERYFKLSADQGYAPAQDNLAALIEEKSVKEAEKKEAYQNAINLYFEGKYAEAKEAFEALGDYERSADFVAMCEKAIQEQNKKKETPVTTSVPVANPTPHIHDWVEATCTEPKTCSVCGATEGDPLGHNWAEAPVPNRPRVPDAVLQEVLPLVTAGQELPALSLELVQFAEQQKGNLWVMIG